jgi:hypothetical protein
MQLICTLQEGAGRPRGDLSPTARTPFLASPLKKEEVRSSLWSPQSAREPGTAAAATREHAYIAEEEVHMDLAGHTEAAPASASSVSKRAIRRLASADPGERLSIVLGRRVRRRARERGKYQEINKDRLLERLRLEHTMMIDLVRLVLFFAVFVLLNFVGEVDKHSIERREVGRLLRQSLDLESFRSIRRLEDIRDFLPVSVPPRCVLLLRYEQHTESRLNVQGLSKSLKEFSAASSARYSNEGAVQIVGAETTFPVPLPLASLSLPVSRSSFTILAWVRIDAEALRGGRKIPLLRKPLSSNPDVSCWGFFFPSTFRFGAHDYHSNGMHSEVDRDSLVSSARWEESVSVSGNDDLVGGSLTHEAIVVDENSITFFRDGVARGPALQLRRPITDCVGTPEVGKGSLANLKFYPRVLMPSEVSEIYQNGQPVVETATGSLLNTVEEEELALIRGAIQNATDNSASFQKEISSEEAILLEVSENRLSSEEQTKRSKILYSYTDDLAPCAALPWWEDESKLPAHDLEIWKKCGSPKTNRSEDQDLADTTGQARMASIHRTCPDDNENVFFCSHSTAYPLHERCSTKEKSQLQASTRPTALGEAPLCPNGERACCCLPRGQQCAPAADDQGRSRRQKAALLLVDVQDCFLENGSLPIPESSSIIKVINSLRDKRRCLFDLVVKTADYHPRNHISFASTHGEKAVSAQPMGFVCKCVLSEREREREREREN